MNPPAALRCLIADDDTVICDAVEVLLQKAGGPDCSIKAHDGLTALNLIATGAFDLVFLDMHMPGLEGECLLRAMPPGLPVIVISASREFAAQSYDFDVVDYLVKPLDFTRFCIAWNKACQRIAKRTGTIARQPAAIFVKDGTKVLQVNLESLLLIKAEANYVDFISEEKSVMSLLTLKKLEKLLPAKFIRVHRSYIVNRDRISRVEDGQVIVGKHKVPVGDFYREDFMRQLRIVQ